MFIKLIMLLELLTLVVKIGCYFSS